MVSLRGMKQLLLICAVVALVGCSPKIKVDPILEKEIRVELNKPTGKLTKADLEKLIKLDLGHYLMTDDILVQVPKDLQKLTQLEELTLTGNQLTDVKGLENLTKLEFLYLSGNQLAEVPKGLEKLTQLRTLNLYDNQLTDVEGLEKLTQLTWLYLNDNQLTSVKGLEKLTKLTKLYLDNNPDLTKAQIDELKKALPKCEIGSNPTK